MVSVLAFIFLESSQDAEVTVNTNLPQSYATITAKDLGVICLSIHLMNTKERILVSLGKKKQLST